MKFVIERDVASVDEGSHYGVMPVVLMFIISIITHLDKLRILCLCYSSQTRKETSDPPQVLVSQGIQVKCWFRM
jgi:hypothetical protein